MRDSLADPAERAAATPLEPGARGRPSSKGLVPGEPIAPAIVAILRAADRPLSSAEIASTVHALGAAGAVHRDLHAKRRHGLA